MATPTTPSLADRVGNKPLDAATASFAPAAATPSTSWADDVASPPPEESNPPESLADAQLDGAAEPHGGSGLHDTQYEVEVKLSDIQGDVNSPLYSINSFEQLGM